MIPVYLFQFLLRVIPLLCQWSRLFAYLLIRIFSGSECLCPTLGMFYDNPVFAPQQVSLSIVDRLVEGVLMATVVIIVYELPIEL